jgi:uncharacterized membrane protein YkvA (DUF1232 family)
MESPTTAARRGAGRSRRRRAGGALVRRTLGYLAFLPLAARAPIYAGLVVDLLADPRVPVARKAALAGAAGYLILGRDLVPDEIPILGGIDDLIVVLVAVNVFLDGVPAEVLDERLGARGIERTEFLRDVARLRQLTPRPIRLAISRATQLAEATHGIIRRSGVGRRVRARVAKEGPHA